MMKKKLVICAVILACLTILICLLLPKKAPLIDPAEIISVSVDEEIVSAEAQKALVSLLNEHQKTWFPVGADDPNTLSVAVRIDCRDGGFYLLHYQYYSGFSFSPQHPGEDDYRSILTYFDADGTHWARKLAYEFDAAFKDWYDALEP